MHPGDPGPADDPYQHERHDHHLEEQGLNGYEEQGAQCYPLQIQQGQGKQQQPLEPHQPCIDQKPFGDAEVDQGDGEDDYQNDIHLIG